MNYFAHGFHVLDQPYVLAGTALPDWLSVADRPVRLRPRYVEPFQNHEDSVLADIANGVLRHFHDDDWFHRTPAFYLVSGELTRWMRTEFNDGEGYRFSFLGHILTELLLDAVLIEDHPEKLNEYYRVVQSLDASRIQKTVNKMARRRTTRLAGFIEIFAREQFLRDYLDDDRLLYRLNQVMHRVGLNRLPREFLTAIRHGREIVRESRNALLPKGLYRAATPGATN